MSDKEENILQIEFNRINPKPDAPKYEFETIQEMFHFLTNENVERFLKEFSDGIRVAVSTREAVFSLAKDMAEKDKQEFLEKSNEAIGLKRVTWIDD